MFVNQFSISLFGTMLSMSTMRIENRAFAFAVSLFAIAFYLVLLYTMIWEIGAKDKISVDVGKKEYRPMTGLYMGLIANIPNLFFALVFTVGYPFMATQKWAGVTSLIVRLYTVICEGMYLGVMTTLPFGAEVKLNNMWWTYFVITIPAIATAMLAYYIGHKDFRLLSLFAPKKVDAKTNKK